MLYQLLISLPMMVCGFWLTFFVVRCFQSEQEPQVTRLLACFYLAATVLYTNHWLYFSGYSSTLGEWSYAIANLCVYPIYYAYLRALTRTKQNWEIVVLLLPAVVIAVLSPLGMRLMGRIAFTAQVIWVLVRGYRLLLHTILRMDNTYSDDRSRLLRPTYMMLLLLGLTSFASMVLNVIGRDYFAHETFVMIPAIVMSVLLFGLGYVAAHTTIPHETVEEEQTTDGLSMTGEEHDFVTTEETDELMYKIGTTLREQQLFTNPHLTIQDLATAVSSNRTYVSGCINRCTGYSFTQYVARYRVEHAQTILRDPSYETDKAALADAMALSGFTSEQTFYRVFKEVTGFTPLQFRKSINKG